MGGRLRRPLSLSTVLARLPGGLLRLNCLVGRLGRLGDCLRRCCSLPAFFARLPGRLLRLRNRSCRLRWLRGRWRRR